jgi:inorganic triphosphatase YgiF
MTGTTLPDADETELKLALDARALAVLLADDVFFTPGTKAQKQVSTYFDTPCAGLKKAGLTLRVRRIGERRVQTLKAASGKAASLFVRPEWEHDIKGDVPEVDGLMRLFGGALDGAGMEGLSPVFTTHVNRARAEHVHEGSRIELVADKGMIRAGNRRATICEIELELLEGDRRALFALARMISARVPVRLGVCSKSDRGHALLAGDAGGAPRADPIWLGRDMTAADAFAAIVAACIHHYRVNEDLLLASGDVEAVHQCRVALRRLRSALSIFQDCLDPASDHFRHELEWISGLLGAVRNVDVMIPRIDGQQALHTLRRARKQRQAELVAALDSMRMRNLLLDLVEYSVEGDWRRGEIAMEPARDFARQSLDRLRRRVKRKGRHFRKMTEQDRHRLRIAGKKLRYASEFFTALFPGRKAGRRREDLLSALEDLQTELGELNDMVVGRALLAELGVTDAGTLLPSASSRHVRKLLDRAGDCHERLVDAKRFWR